MRENRGQNRVRISDPFLGPFSIGTLSTGSKNGVPFLGPRFGRRSTATTFTLELAFGTMKSGRGSKQQCQMQADNLYDYMWHPVIFAQLQPKRAGWFQLAACTHVRTGSCTLQQQCWKTLFRRWSNAQPHDSARLLLFLVVSRSLISSSC